MVAMAVGVQADTIWIGANGGNFNTASNWDNGAPSGTQIAWITNSGANVTMTNATAAAITHVYVTGTGTAPTLNISQDFKMSTTASRSLNVGGGNAANQSGIVNHTAGTFTGQRIFIAASTNTAAITGRSGTYNFSGGAISMGSTAGSLISVGARANETGYFNLSGNGTVAAEQLTLGLYNGNGNVKVEGGGLTLNFGQINMAGTYSGNGSTKIEAVFTGTGFSTINVATNVLFDFGSGSNGTEFQLSLGSGFVYSNNVTYTIIDAAGDFTGYGRFGNVTNNQVITVDGKQFTANYITDPGANDKFTLTTIPEPTTVGLFVISAAGLMVARRMQMFKP
jgi:hypothetical protein